MRRSWIHGAGAAALALIAGCAQVAPVPAVVADSAATTVTLMPDEDGKIGEVTVRTRDDVRVVNQAYASVSAMQSSTQLSPTLQAGEARLAQEHAALLKAQPSKPRSFLLYFSTGAELTQASQALLAQVLATIRTRSPTEVIIIGHTDTVGTDETNMRLSRLGANLVEKALRSSLRASDHLTVKSFGAKDLLVETPIDTFEPRNRRVEVVVL